MILCVSPNLCYDRVIVVRGFRVGEVHRAESAQALASGKGLNIARAARALGVPVTVAGMVSGEAASAILRGATEAGLTLDAVRVRGPARICTLIVDPGRSETVVNEPGPEVGPAAVRALRAKIMRRLGRAGLVIIAGSLPPGMSVEFPAAVIREAAPRMVILDTPGEAFRAGVSAGPAVAKLNHRELEATLSRALPEPGDVVEASRQLLARGARAVLVTMGGCGAILSLPEGAWRLSAPRVDRVNAIGAGDSLSAGLAAGLLRGQPLLEAVRWGMAAAASDVSTLLPGTVEPARLETLRQGVQVEVMD